MTKFKRLTIICFSLFALYPASYSIAQTNKQPTSKEYKLVWHDEFNAPDGTAPDTTKWMKCPRSTATWSRFCSNSPDVAYQSGGCMVLKAMPNPDLASDTAQFITGGIQSKGKFSFTYGKVECRAKVVQHEGTFPAIWLLPVVRTGGWPACGEIDIFETINNENTSYQTVHSRWTYTLGNTTNPPHAFHVPTEMEDQFHTYGLTWDADSISWSVDGKYVGTYPRVPAHEADGQWPFNKPFYVILNQSVGEGGWAKAPDPNHTYTFYVDWVRVYQRK